jgi:hypothetical protein
VTSTFSVTPGTFYCVYVGGLGTSSGTGGFNGGGAGGTYNGYCTGGSGGTDVRTTVKVLTSRIIIAGGGG